MPRSEQKFSMVYLKSDGTIGIADQTAVILKSFDDEVQLSRIMTKEEFEIWAPRRSRDFGKQRP